MKTNDHTMLSCRQLLAGPATPERALRQVSLEAYFGEMLYIVGPSASGKTTLLSVLSGILRPDSGGVSVEGSDIWNLGSDKLADFRLHKIGFVFQDYHLFPRLTTAENVAVPLILKRTELERSDRRSHASIWRSSV